MTEFCSVDDRLLASCYVPLADFDRSAAMAADAIDMGAAALLIASGCPNGHSPLPPQPRSDLAAGRGGRHPGRVPRRRYGSSDRSELLRQRSPDPARLPRGEENFRSVDYMAIPFPPMQTLATMIFDGVLERFPRLRIAVIDQGCSWLKQTESAMEAFVRHEERLPGLSITPREFAERQVRVTPYPTEDVGWVTEQVGADILMFDTDYPHVEGGRRPYERFEASLGRANASRPAWAVRAVKYATGSMPTTSST